MSTLYAPHKEGMGGAAEEKGPERWFWTHTWFSPSSGWDGASEGNTRGQGQTRPRSRGLKHTCKVCAISAPSKMRTGGREMAESVLW